MSYISLKALLSQPVRCQKRPFMLRLGIKSVLRIRKTKNSMDRTIRDTHKGAVSDSHNRVHLTSRSRTIVLMAFPTRLTSTYTYVFLCRRSLSWHTSALLDEVTLLLTSAYIIKQSIANFLSLFERETWILCS